MASVENTKLGLQPLLEKMAEYPAETVEEDKESARIARKSLAVGFPDFTHEQQAQVGYVLGMFLGTLTSIDIRTLAHTLDNSTVGYALAAASLLGLYDIEEPKPAAKPSDFYGQYL